MTPTAASDASQPTRLGRRLRSFAAASIGSRRFHAASGGQLDPELMPWIRGLPDATRRKLKDIGLLDEKHAGSPALLRQHLADYENTLTARENTPKHVRQTTMRIRRIIEGCDFKHTGDISASKTLHFLHGHSFG